MASAHAFLGVVTGVNEMKDLDLVEMGEEMLHEVVGAAQAITCKKGETIELRPNADGSITVSCD